MTGTTVLIRIKKETLKDVFDVLKKIMAKERMIDEKEISYPDVSIELRKRILNAGGLKENK